MTFDQNITDRPHGLFAGLSTVDLAYSVDDMPRRNQKISTSVPQVAAGGPATNAAITFAFLGGKSALITAVGQHALGAVIRRDLDGFNVCLHDVAVEQDVLPPVSSILVLPNGDRSVISANARAFPDVSVKISPNWFNHARFVLLDGHYPALCNAVASQGRAAGLNVVLDAGSWKAGTDALLSNTTIALCSNDFRPSGCATTDDVFHFLRNRGIERVAITRGADSILYFDKGISGEIPVQRVNAVDTTAAGDVFHGAFCYRFLLRFDFVDALSFAAEVATFSCLHLGTRSWMEAYPRDCS